MKRAGYTGYLVPVIAVSAMLVMLTLTLSHLAAVHDDMRNGEQANMTWVLSQTRIKGLELKVALQRYDYSHDAHQELTHRLALLLSRLHLLEDGPQRRFLETMDAQHSLAPETSSLLTLYERAQHEPESVQPHALLEQLAFLQQDLAHIAQKAMLAQWELDGQKLDSYRNTVLTAIMLLVGILVCSAFISINLLMALKRVHQAHAMELRSLELEARLISEQQANELYRHFASMMSHQFRTPLAIMDASLQRLLRNTGPLSREELSRRVGKSRDAISRLTDVLDALLTTDKPLATRHAPVATHELRPLAERAIAIQLLATPDARFELLAENSQPVLAHCNPGMTEQILLNLLSNAAKYGPAGHKIRVRIHTQEQAACCSISDAGGQLNTEDIPLLFKRSFRGEHASKIKGSGLGLSIARQLAQLQAGRIRVEVDPGEHTTFTLVLPQEASTPVRETDEH